MRIAASVGVMVVVLVAIGPLPGIAGMVVLVAAGGATYAIAAIVLNVLDIRTALVSYAGWIPGRTVRAS